ncbi:MAG: hypothetical protein HZA54_11440 [Planctomycetes bacterium]|nr:hypothetical protein [Planctomycetota bacterium]
MCTGLLADADHTYGVDAMRRMVQNLTAAVAADERFDRAGAHRLLGILYTRAPGPPSGVGSSRRALKELRRAAELFPGDAENLRYLGEAEVEAGERAAAAEHLQAAVAAPAVPGRSAEQAAWRRDAAALLARLEAPEK